MLFVPNGQVGSVYLLSEGSHDMTRARHLLSVIRRLPGPVGSKWKEESIYCLPSGVKEALVEAGCIVVPVDDSC